MVPATAIAAAPGFSLYLAVGKDAAAIPNAAYR